jgi:hypothetical protein
MLDQDTLVTPTEMLGRVREVHATVRAAEAELLGLACAWADAHPAETAPEPHPARRSLGTFDDLDPGSEGEAEPDERRGIPGYAWDCAAPFAAAVGRTTQAGDALLRDALVLRHRLPRVWGRVLAGEVDAYRARRIAQAVLGRPDDVCAFLDDTVARIAHKVGAVTLDRLLDEAMLRLHAEERELAQLAELDARYVKVDEGSINDAGVAEMEVRGDWKDLHDFDQAVSAVARVLTELEQADPSAPGHWDSFETRRSRAVGILADPAQALALLGGTPAPAPRSKRAQLVLHLSEDAVKGFDPVGRNATTGRAVLTETIRAWCGRTDTHLTVTPVVDLTEHVSSDAYEIRDRLKTRIDLVAGTCVFPWCTRPARSCDHDHVVAHQATDPTSDGATCDCNIAPLCRRHHRLKTHAGWTYTSLDTGRWLWSDPHGQQFLRDPEGTLPAGRSTAVAGRRPGAGPAPRPAPADAPLDLLEIPPMASRAPTTIGWAGRPGSPVPAAARPSARPRRARRLLRHGPPPPRRDRARLPACPAEPYPRPSERRTLPRARVVISTAAREGARRVTSRPHRPVRHRRRRRGRGRPPAQRDFTGAGSPQTRHVRTTSSSSSSTRSRRGSSTNTTWPTDAVRRREVVVRPARPGARRHRGRGLRPRPDRPLVDHTTYSVAGDHGGIQRYAQQIPIVFAGGGLSSPDLQAPVRSVDVMPMILRHMGIPATYPMDGIAYPLPTTGR